MALIYIDGKQYTVKDKNNLLQVSLSLGLNIPYFCWHPALGSIGACRQCAVKVYKDKDDKYGQIVMSCMTSIKNGMIISIKDQFVQEFRKTNIECLMINHPHDCPVCEEGGHCHLQDMTVMTGHKSRVFRFNKRTHRNQDLGPFINHEMNRCITCYRCVRYYKDYAGGKDLGTYGSRDNIYFGRLTDGKLESEFSGNLVEVCPTGVFTDKTHSIKYNRKWDMQFSPSVCHQCSVGCNISLGERYGEIRRIENRYNGAINHYFLCDRGRFGYGYMNLKNRPLNFKVSKKILNYTKKEIVSTVSAKLLQSDKIIGIGSARASIESNFSLLKLVGKDNFYCGINEKEHVCLNLILKLIKHSGIHVPSLKEIESYDVVIILGEDITQTGPRISLAVRQAVKNKIFEMAASQKIFDWQISAVLNAGQKVRNNPLFITSNDKNALSDIAAWNYYAPIEDQAKLGFAIANAIDSNAPKIEGLNNDLKNKVVIISQALKDAKKPLIVSGSSANNVDILHAASNICVALKNTGYHGVGITLVPRAVNSIGLGMLSDNSLEDGIEVLKHNSKVAILNLENDLYQYLPVEQVSRVLSGAFVTVTIDHVNTKFLEGSHFVLPTTNFSESDGTVINNEGRAQRFFRGYDLSYYRNNTPVMESWRWLHLISLYIKNTPDRWNTIECVIKDIIKEIPALKKIQEAAPSSSFRIAGQKISRLPNRYSGRTAIHANRSVHEPKQPIDSGTMLNFSMEGYNQPSKLHSQIPFAWFPGWNSPQAWNKFQSEVGGSLKSGDSGIRLFEKTSERIGYFFPNTRKLQKERNKWRVIPLYHLFGSEELSQMSPVCRTSIPSTYIVLNPEDAESIDFYPNDSVTINFGRKSLNALVKISTNILSGQVGLPIGLPGIPFSLINEYISILKE